MKYLNGNLTADEVRKTDLYARGDCINIWVNQGEFEMLQMEHETMRQQLAQQPSVDVLVEALREIIIHDDSAYYYCAGIATDALASYGSMNEAKPIEKDVK